MARVEARGYTLDEVRGCIVREDGDQITVDETHPDYPRERASQCRAGEELKGLLGRLGIAAKPECKCLGRARLMDQKGCDWCWENLETISGWLEEEAKSRGLIYSHAAGKALIALAIRRARKSMPKPGPAPT